jgi:hypothetical protein
VNVRTRLAAKTLTAGQCADRGPGGALQAGGCNPEAPEAISINHVEVSKAEVLQHL